MSRIPDFLKYLENRIAVALSRAELAYQGVQALGNAQSFTNGSIIGPGATLNFTSPTFTSKSGKVLILAAAGVTGGTTTDPCASILLRDTTTVGANVNTNQFLTGSVNALLVNTWVDAAAGVGAHTFTLRISSTGSASMEIAATGATMVLVDLPTH